MHRSGTAMLEIGAVLPLPYTSVSMMRKSCGLKYVWYSAGSSIDVQMELPMMKLGSKAKLPSATADMASSV